MVVKTRCNRIELRNRGCVSRNQTKSYYSHAFSTIKQPGHLDLYGDGHLRCTATATATAWRYNKQLRRFSITARKANLLAFLAPSRPCRSFVLHAVKPPVPVANFGDLAEVWYAPKQISRPWFYAIAHKQGSREQHQSQTHGRCRRRAWSI